MCIIILHISHFSYFAAKVLQQTAKTCQYGEENTKKMQKSDFFCIFLFIWGGSATKKAVIRLGFPLYTLHYTLAALLPLLPIAHRPN